MSTPTITPPIRHGNVWVFENGTTLPVISGGDGPDENAGGEGTPPPEGNEPPPAEGEDEELRPEGVKALGIWKNRAKAAEDAKAELEAQLQAIADANLSEQEKALKDAVAAAEERVRTEERTSTQRERFSDKLAVAAAGKLVDTDLLADPDVALKLLGLDSIPVTETGAIDAGAISAAVDALIEARPYLAVTDGAKPPTPLTQGPRGNANSTAVKTLDQQIAAAEQAGDWTAAQSLKSQKLIELAARTPKG